MPRRIILVTVSSMLMAANCARADAGAVTMTGEVVDPDTAKPLACRIYISDEHGRWHFVQSASPQGSAITYSKQNWANKNSLEMHTTISAHPFTVDLPPGNYTITVERGKEYFPLTKPVTVCDEPAKLRFPLKRWINMAELGWYSGDTHVHRTLQELPNVQLAEDLNVSFPLLYWVHKAFLPPSHGDRSIDSKTEPRLINVDDTHVIYPLNTEYEITRVNGERHTLGAFFVLNHKAVFTKGAPPVAPIAETASQEAGLLELDKHNWPWSMMLVPVMGIDLYELANNHMWRTEFALAEFGEAPPEYMDIETNAKGFTELGWIQYGFQNYYALLNCGFRLRPTAGTASGVHPVPLGFGRVYVKLKGNFNYQTWVQGLDEGRSFVTTGPMLFTTINDYDPGHVFEQCKQSPVTYFVVGTAQSACPAGRIEILVNGQVARKVKPQNKKLSSGAYQNKIDETIDIEASSWIAVRCFEERPDGRVRFAHTGPFHIDVEGRPLRPRKAEADFLVKRMKEQIRRNEGVLPQEALKEYHQALQIYQQIAQSAK